MMSPFSIIEVTYLSGRKVWTYTGLVERWLRHSQ